MYRAEELGLKFILGLQGLNGNYTQLTELVLRFSSHPALLAWYLADEPDGWGIPPESIRVRPLIVPLHSAESSAGSSHNDQDAGPVSSHHAGSQLLLFIPAMDLQC